MPVDTAPKNEISLIIFLCNTNGDHSLRVDASSTFLKFHNEHDDSWPKAVVYSLTYFFLTLSSQDLSTRALYRHLFCMVFEESTLDTST